MTAGSAAKPRRRSPRRGDPGIPPAQGRWPGIIYTEKVDVILEGVRAGLPFVTASRRAKISDRTARRWLARGRASLVAVEEGDEAGLPVAPDEPYHTFAETIDAYRGNVEAGLVAVVIQAARSDPDHAKWILERQYRENWMPPHRLDVTVAGDPDTPVAFAVSAGPDLYAPLDRLRGVLAALAEAGDPAALAMAHVIDTTATDATGS